MRIVRGTKGFSPQPAEKGRAPQVETLILNWKEINMNVTKLIVAAGFAVATTGAFAETGVNTTDVGHVSNVYGRAGVATVKIQGTVASTAATVADSGRETVKGDTQIAVTAGDKDVNGLGRS
jgi:hypothetical protein